MKGRAADAFALHGPWLVVSRYHRRFGDIVSALWSPLPVLSIFRRKCPTSALFTVMLARFFAHLASFPLFRKL